MSTDSESKSGAALGCGFMILMLAYGLAQVVAGYAGIEHHLGKGWAIAAIVVAFLFRFTLPITVGSFFGAMNVWGWHWLGALVFAAPGLAFMALMISGTLASTMARLKR